MFDLIIIGYGVSGMTASIYALRSGLNTLIIEQTSPGGVLNKINKIENYPGFEEISGPDLAFNMFMQAQKYNPNLKIEKVLKITKENDSFIVKTNLNEYKSKSVIISSGRTRNKKLLKNEDELLGKGLSYCAICDGNLYKDKNVIVLGDNALEDAIYLSGIVKKVYLITNNSVNNLKENVELINSNIKDVVLENDIISAVKFENNDVINVDGIFISNNSNDISNIYDDKTIFNDNGYIIVDDNMRTKIRHLYACGDVINKKVYQIVTACSDGAKAALSAKEDLQ